MKRAFCLVQEGGSSHELYLHAHQSAEEAEQDRINFAVVAIVDALKPLLEVRGTK